MSILTEPRKLEPVLVIDIKIPHIVTHKSVFRHNGFVESSYELYIFTVPGPSAAGKCGSV